MGMFCSKIMRYLAMLFMVSIFIPGSSQMPDDQFLSIAGKLLDREHGTGNNIFLIYNCSRENFLGIKC